MIVKAKEVQDRLSHLRPDVPPTGSQGSELPIGRVLQTDIRWPPPVRGWLTVVELVTRRREGHFGDVRFADVIRIRREPWLAGFRKAVARVIAAAGSGNVSLLRASRDEVFSARQKFRTAVGIDAIGLIVTYVSVPVSVVEAIIGTVESGISLSVVGLTGMIYGRSLKRGSLRVVQLP